MMLRYLKCNCRVSCPTRNTDRFKHQYASRIYICGISQAKGVSVGGKRHAAVGSRSEAATPTAFSKAAQAAAAGALSLALLLQPSAHAEEMSIAFPASTDPAIRRAQQTMVEAWAYVDGLYLDPTLSHEEWSKALQDSLAASFKAGSPSEVDQLTGSLLSSLGDPYTRVLQGEDAVALAAEEQGKIVATGLGLQQVSFVADSDQTAEQQEEEQQQQQQGEQMLMVSFVVENSPAAAAGVKEGDILLGVAGQPVQGKQLRDIYKLLSKEADVTFTRQDSALTAAAMTAASSGSSSSGSSSSGSSYGSPLLQLAPADAGRRLEAGVSQDLPGAAATAATISGIPGSSTDATYTVHLKPEPLEFAPVQYGIIHPDRLISSSEDGSINLDGSSSSSSSTSSTSSSSMPGIAYLKLLSFSTTAPQEVAEALIDMQQLKTRQQLQQEEQQQQLQQQQEQQGPNLAGLILDLRDNVGGVVEAGVDIAQDFLSAGQVLCIAVDRTGQEERVVLPAAHTLTHLPLVVLVNHNTASTAELVAGALHDGLSAPLIGTTTYGKGRSQRVVQLSDGSSTLLVSTIKYFTPEHTEIDKVGLQPGVLCDPEEVGGQRWQGGRLAGEGDAGSLLDDPCIRLATEKLQSLLGPLQS